MGLYDQVVKLLENEDIRIKFGKEGRRHIVKYFSWGAVAGNLHNIYMELIQQSGKAMKHG